MNATGSRRLRRYVRIAAAACGVLMGLVALIMLGRYASSLADFGRRHVFILAINAVAAVVLLGLIAINLLRLVRDYRRRAPGARLRDRKSTRLNSSHQ